MVQLEPGVRNDAVAWSDFDANEYWKLNFKSVLPEDAQIIEYREQIPDLGLRDARTLQGGGGRRAGTNLYPGLLMLPWAERIVFTDFASDNIRWLNENLADGTGKWQWQRFWEKVAHQPCYQDVKQPRRRLAAAHEVRSLSIFDLPTRAWDLGSMFFVADGITEDHDEFEAAVRAFLGALVPGSPFLMAFMEGSTGYDVHGVKFPRCG